MKKNLGMALVLGLGLASSCAWAEWQPFQRDSAADSRYEIGGAQRMDGGVVLVEFKRMVIRLKQHGFVVVDQFVAMCRESSHNRPSVFKLQRNVYLDEGEGEKLRTLSTEKFDPPKESPATDPSAIELGARVCREAPL